jgi:hypothetical protein
MTALAEMSAYLPHKKGFAGYATRFVDPALGKPFRYEDLSIAADEQSFIKVLP